MCPFLIAAFAETAAAVVRMLQVLYLHYYYNSNPKRCNKEDVQLPCAACVCACLRLKGKQLHLIYIGHKIKHFDI